MNRPSSTGKSSLSSRGGQAPRAKGAPTTRAKAFHLKRTYRSHGSAGHTETAKSFARKISGLVFRPGRVVDPLHAAFRRGDVVKDELRAEAGGFLSARDLRERFGLSDAAIAQQISEGRLLVIEDRGPRFPAIQFDARRPGQLRPGLGAVLKVLRERHDARSWGQLLFLMTPNPRLGDRRPIDALKEREAVVSAAEQYLEHGAP